MSSLDLHTPRVFMPLLKPSRYKGAHGGRASAKSHFFAEQALVKALVQPTRIVCIREVQNSIKDSVRQLLADKVSKLGISRSFQVLESEIRGPQESLITFRGMQSFNADNIKSLEGYDIAWVEEAQTLSQRSLELLRPTIRKESSELWFSWNPRFKTDPVDRFLRSHPPADAVSVEVNWRDNPWFPDVLKREMAHDFETDEDQAEHIWNGAYSAGRGTILAKWVNRAERDDRITDAIAFDPDGAPVEISSDIGFRDTASWWFWQPILGGFNVFHYEQDSGLDADDWCERITQTLDTLGIERKKLGRIWLPTDAKAKTFATKHSAQSRFWAGFGEGKVEIVPPTKKADQISAARKVIEQCRFNKTACEDGLDGLRAWEFVYIEDAGVLSREPLHNWASHPADAFAYGCQVMQSIKAAAPPQEIRMKGLAVGNGASHIQLTFNELRDMQKKRREMSE